jgi:hypothetical protein
VAVKDLSRLGRNYIVVGRLTEEVFPNLGCRFVALNDSVDTLLGENDMMVYRNLFNEFYAKDTSKKVKAVKRAYMQRGKFLGTYPPLGYKRDPADHLHLIIDEETAPIVRRIFQMRSGGAGYRTIAAALNAEQVPSPKDIYFRKKGCENPYKYNHCWNDSTVRVILKNQAYIGNLEQGRTGSLSYKNHKLVNKPRENWITVENTHEPLIERSVWDEV